MKEMKATTLLAISLLAVTPQKVAADLKDALVGGAVAAIISEGLKQEQKKATPQKRSSNSTSARNYQYSRDERIQIQTALRDMGYNVGVVDGILGRNSRRAISAFQSSRGEAQTGQLTREQFAALTNAGLQNDTGFGAPAAVIQKRPLNSQEIALMQQGLHTLGHYNGTIDGSQNADTVNAAIAFLTTQGLTPQDLTPVQIVVLVRNTAGLQTPPYLLQEADPELANNAANIFGAPVGQAETGTPQSMFGNATQPSTPSTNDLFAAPGQQPDQGPQVIDIFATGNTAQAQPGAQPANGSSLDIFSGTGATQPAQGDTTVTRDAQQADTLDIFSGSN